MEFVDPTTGEKLPPETIQRVLFVAKQVFVYKMPSLSLLQGSRLDETSEHIFTGRLRLLETSLRRPPALATTPTTMNHDSPSQDIKVDLLIEDASTGELFAAAPYVSTGVVESIGGHSRAFAVQVRNQAMKATLGVGFEKHSDAMDFKIALQDAGKVLRLASVPGNGASASRAGAPPAAGKDKLDFSLKAGETITVSIGGRGRRSRTSSAARSTGDEAKDAQAALFSIKPPPATGGSSGAGDDTVPWPPAPPATSSVNSTRRRSRPPPPQDAISTEEKQPSPQELGFDDGEFGEFQ